MPNIMSAYLVSIFTMFVMLLNNCYASEMMCPNGSNPDPNVIWCDSFEDEDLGSSNTIGGNYFNFSPGTDPNNMTRDNSESIHGSYSLKNHWSTGAGASGSGSFMRTFGRNPVNSLSHSSQDFDEIYWRFYVKLQAGFTGQAGKLTRAFIFAGNNWAQAMSAHLWASGDTPLFLDPASGINMNNDQLATTQWNDFANLKWLGQLNSSTKLEPDKWYCIEVHVKLNTPSSSNGIFEFWRDSVLQASSHSLNWINNWSDYGINTIMFSDYWNDLSPKDQERYIDALVISTDRIGCINSVAPPKPPSKVIVQ
jgi:hypothetical protein